jgi:hypothetical protein
VGLVGDVRDRFVEWVVAIVIERVYPEDTVATQVWLKRTTVLCEEFADECLIELSFQLCAERIQWGEA